MGNFELNTAASPASASPKAGRARTLATFGLLLMGFAALASGCAQPELDPAPSPVLEGPEYTMPREEKKNADPPPPIREHRLDTSPQSSQAYIYLSEQPPAVAPNGSSTVVNPVPGPGTPPPGH